MKSLKVWVNGVVYDAEVRSGKLVIGDTEVRPDEIRDDLYVCDPEADVMIALWQSGFRAAPEPWGLRLRRFMREHAMTLQRCSRETGIPVATLKLYRVRYEKPSPGSYRKLTKVLRGF